MREKKNVALRNQERIFDHTRGVSLIIPPYMWPDKYLNAWIEALTTLRVYTVHTRATPPDEIRIRLFRRTFSFLSFFFPYRKPIPREDRSAAMLPRDVTFWRCSADEFADSVLGGWLTTTQNSDTSNYLPTARCDELWCEMDVRSGFSPLRCVRERGTSTPDWLHSKSPKVGSGVW